MAEEELHMQTPHHLAQQAAEVLQLQAKMVNQVIMVELEDLELLLLYQVHQ